MKKILTLTLVFVTILSLAIPAFASDGSASSSAKTFSWTSWWDWWNNGSSNKSTNPSESDVTEPAIDKNTEMILGTTTITESRFYHTGVTSSLKNRLQIKWEAVENAESYEIEVTKVDGTMLLYTSTSTSLLVKNAECPKMYVEETHTWTAATVRVRAVADNSVGVWSSEAKIGCDKIH